MGAMLSGFLQGVAGKLGPEMERRHADEEALKATKRQALLKAMTMPEASPQERQMYWEEYQKTLSHAKPIKELAGKANQILGHVFKHSQTQGSQAPQASQGPSVTGVSGQKFQLPPDQGTQGQAAQMLPPPTAQPQAPQGAPQGGKRPGFDYAGVMGKVGQAPELEAQREDARKLKLFEAEAKVKEPFEIAREKREHINKMDEIKATAESRGEKVLKSWTGDDGKIHMLVQRPGEAEPVEEIRGGVLTAATKPKKAWVKGSDGKPYSILVDPKTNQPIPGTEDRTEIPPGYMLDKIRTGEFTWVDENGNIHRAPTTSVTKPVLPGPGNAPTSTTTTSGSKAPKAPKASKAVESKLPAPKGDRVIGRGKLGAAEQQLVNRAETVMRAGVSVMRDLDSLPKTHPDWVGPVHGRIMDIKRKIGVAPQEVSDLLATVHSVENFLPSLHGLRGKYPLDAWGKILQDPLVNPAATKSAIRGALKAVEEYRRTILKRENDPNLTVEGLQGESNRGGDGAVEFVRDEKGNIVPKSQ